MDRAAFAGIVLAIATRWPHPDLTADHDAQRALLEDIGHLEPELVHGAIRRLVSEGERWQPRGPAIIGQVRELQAEAARMAAELESEERIARRRLQPGPAEPPPNIAEVIDRIRRRP